MQRRRRRSPLAGHLVCVVVAALLAAAAWMHTRALQPAEMDSYYYDDYRMPDQCLSVYQPSEKGKKNTSIGKIRQDKKSKDTQLYLDFREGKTQKFRGVIVRFGKTFPYDMQCTLHYENRAGRLDYNCKTTVKLPRGEKTAYIALPEDRYYDMKGFRLDFEEDYADALEEILITEERLIGHYRPQDHASNRPVRIVFLAALVLLEILRFLLPEIREGAEALREKCRGARAFFLVAGIVAVNAVIAADLIFQLPQKPHGAFWTGFLVLAAVITSVECLLLARRLPEREREERNRHAGPGSREDLLAGLLYGGLMLGLCVQVYLAFRDGYYEKWQELDGAHLWLPFAALLVQMVLLGLLYRKYVWKRREDRIDFEKIYLLLFFLLGLSYLFLFLPFVSADETDHFLSAYRVSNLFLGQIGQLGDERLLMRLEDYSFFAARRQVLSAVYYREITENLHVFRKQAGYVIADGPMVTNALLAYLPAGAGIALARILQLGGVMTFWAGRLGNLIFCTAMLGRVMKKLPFGQTALFAMAMFPMVLQTAGSCSYDGPTLCFALLFIAHVMQMAWSEGRIRRRDYILCMFYGMLLAPSKLVYVPLLMLVFLVPQKNLSGRADRALVRKCMIVAAGLFAVLFLFSMVRLLGAGSAIQKMVEDNATVHLLKWGKHEEGYTISWLLQHPLKYLVMCLRTLTSMADYYLFTMVGTKLGWLNVNLPTAPMAISLFVFVLSVNIREAGEPDRTASLAERAWILLLCAGTIMIVLLAMALDWTPLSDNYISGVQGRYFLPLLGTGLWTLRTPLLKVQSEARRYIVFYEVIMNLLLLVHVFTIYMIST